jgi:uncharacterized protein YfkK (UPF0435 family)
MLVDLLIVRLREGKGDDAMNGKNYLIATIISAMILTLIFIPMSGSQTTVPYDPWCDLNDDGIIDIYDVVLVTSKYDSTGEPVNKTALLYNINQTLTELLTKIDSLNASLLDLEAYVETRITELYTIIIEHESRISELEAELAILNATKLGKPDYDSFKDPEVGEWKYLQPDIPWRFDHHLNTNNVIVYLVFSNDSVGTNINHHWYGGQNSGTWWGGAWWSELTKDYIMVTRYAHSNECAYVRVMIWKIPQ